MAERELPFPTAWPGERRGLAMGSQAGHLWRAVKPSRKRSRPRDRDRASAAGGNVLWGGRPIPPLPSQRLVPMGSSGKSPRCPGAFASRRPPNLDKGVEDPAEQIMRADRLVHVEQVEAEQHEDHVGDDDPGKSRHWRAQTMQGGPVYAQSPLAKKPGLARNRASPTRRATNSLVPALARSETVNF